MTTEAETGAMWPQAREFLQPQRLEEAGNVSVLEPLEGAQPCSRLDFNQGNWLWTFGLPL